MPRRLRRLAGPFVLLLLTGGFYWRLTLTNQYTWLDSPDIAYQVLPWLTSQARTWQAGELPLWDADHWGGQSLVGQAQPGVLYPPNFILFLLPLSNELIDETYLNWYFVLIHVQAAWSAWWLARQLGRSQASSVLAGVVFSYGGYIGATTWPQMLNGAVWAPVIAGFALRAVRTEGLQAVANAGLSGLFLGVAFLSGHHQAPLFLALGMAAFWMGAAWWKRRRVVAPVAAFALLAGLAGAAQILPAIEYGKRSVRWVGTAEPIGWRDRVPYPIHEQHSLPPTFPLALVDRSLDADMRVYAGVTAVVLAGLALWLAGRQLPVRILASFAGLGVALALGGATILHGILYSTVPMVEKARSPAAAILLFHLSVSVLSAYGIDYLRLRIAFAGKLLCGVAASLAALLLSAHWTGSDVAPGAAFVLLGLSASGVLLWLNGSRVIDSSLTAKALILIVVLELGSALPLTQRDAARYVPKPDQHAELVTFLQEQPGRTWIDDLAVPYNFGNLFGLAQYNGYVASMPAALEAVHAQPRTWDLFGVRHTVRPEPELGETEVRRLTGGLRVFHRETAFPEAWIVHRAEAIPPGWDAGMWYQRDDFDLRRETFVPGEPPELEICEGEESAEVVARTANTVRLSVRLACRGMVVLGDGYDPGWKAQSETGSVPILAAYGLLRGVVLPPGNHEVTMSYRPTSVVWGVSLSLVGFLLGGILWFKR
ncbi:MAG: hypothetical protein IPM24_17735 [Bryobacterales bacterium]|nr:hypothetical protein [Bryobacterales bacterium]